MQQPVSTLQDWVPLSKLDQYQNVLSVAATRWHRFMNTDGFNEKVCRRFRHKILVHLPSFYAWIEESDRTLQSGKQGAV
jgi:hypothetical protein